MSFLRTKTGKSIFVFLLLALSILSINKLSYVFLFFRFSLSPPAYKVKNFDLLSQSYLKNQRLSVLIKDKFLGNEHFLASFGAALIVDRQSHLFESRYAALLPHVLKIFPENIFFDHLGIYEERDSLSDWDNFDALSLKLLREPRSNYFVFPVLTQLIIDKEIPDLSLYDLIYYLSWMENFTLAEDLLSWGCEEKKIGEDVYEELKKDLKQRKKERGADEVVIQELSYPSIVSLGDNDLKIVLGRNLLAGGSFNLKNSLKQFWTFSDMSDREPFSKGSFFGDIDYLESSCLRVMCFFEKMVDGKGPARGGFWYNNRIFLQQRPYVFCFRYKTLHESENPSFWLSYGLKEPRTGPASSAWKKVYFVFNNSHFKLEFVKPLLRMWGTGSVWFDDIGLYEIEMEGPVVEEDALFIQ